MSLVESGLIHLYVGDGKGKTTAALGLAMRAIGAGQKVFIAQFLKGRETSELPVLHTLGIVVMRTEDIKVFTKNMNDEEKIAAKISCEELLEKVKKAISSEDYGLVVLDEIVDAINAGFLDTDIVLDIISKRKPHTEIVMTGRNPKDKIVEAADYLTVMTALKHPYQRGVPGRRGIEY